MFKEVKCENKNTAPTSPWFQASLQTLKTAPLAGLFFQGCLFVCMSVCLSAVIHKQLQADFHETGEVLCKAHIKLWRRYGSRSGSRNFALPYREVGQRIWVLKRSKLSEYICSSLLISEDSHLTTFHENHFRFISIMPHFVYPPSQNTLKFIT